MKKKLKFKLDFCGLVCGKFLLCKKILIKLLNHVMLKVVNFLFWLALLLCSFVIVLVIVTASFPFRLVFFAVHRQVTHLQTRSCSNVSTVDMCFLLFLLLSLLRCVRDRPSRTVSCSPYQRDLLWRRATAPALCSTPACCTTSRRWPTRSCSSRRFSRQVRHTSTHTSTHMHKHSTCLCMCITKMGEKGLLLFCKVQKCYDATLGKTQGSVSRYNGRFTLWCNRFLF